MAATPHSTPHFPNELYREIARNLHQRRDKDVLLSLALVSNVWRHESQRVLFSSLSDDWDVGLKPELPHILFLESILAHPDRLGPYVYLYAQDALAVDPITVEDSEYYRDYMRIWDLTSRALPVMINLKHLYMCPIAACSLAEYFLVGCQFQLETLVWKCNEDPQDELINFLRTQRVLTHLQVGDYVQELNLLWLTPDICPTLTSTVCNMESVGLLEHRNDITTLQFNIDERSEELADNVLSVLERIKYLSVWIDITSELSIPIVPNPFLLEINHWTLETLRLLSAIAFPKLRILALLNCDTMLSNPGLRVQVPRLCFGRLPTLETIFMRASKPFGSHLKLSPTEMEVGWVLGECQLGLQWWTVYDMML